MNRPFLGHWRFGLVNGKDLRVSWTSMEVDRNLSRLRQGGNEF